MLVAKRSPQDGEASSASGIGLTPVAFDMAGLVRGRTERVATRSLTLGHVPPAGARWSSLRQGLKNGRGNRITAAQSVGGQEREAKRGIGRGTGIASRRKRHPTACSR